jgi:hypothetical protein
MADVRALLRAERAARAPPSKPRKHNAPAPVSSKKRKAIDDDDTEETRKRSRPQSDDGNLPAGFFDASEDVEEGPLAPIDGFVPAEDEDPGVQKRDTLQEDIAKTEAAVNSSRAKAEAPPAAEDVNEDEWAAFQAFTSAVPIKTISALDALNSNAVLEAAPLTTEQAQQQAREEARLDTKSKREEEIEDEKEEAAEKLEQDFEIQGELDDRVRRLKEKREALRRASRTSQDGLRPVLPSAVVAPPEAVMEEESDEEEVDEFDAWRFGAR